MAVFWWTNIHEIPEQQAISEYLCIGRYFWRIKLFYIQLLSSLSAKLKPIHGLRRFCLRISYSYCIATYVPNYSVQFTFIGRVKLKHIAIFSILLDIISIPKGNAGGHIAHLGGALYGFLYVQQLKGGKDWSRVLADS